MTYYFTKILDVSFDDAIVKTTDALKARGFGVLTTIDVKDTLKKKIGAEFRPYTILGACNPGFAHKALQAEPMIGTMLPCNVIVLRRDDGKIQVSAVDPVASMAAIKNPSLEAIATEVRGQLKGMIDAL